MRYAVEVIAVAAVVYVAVLLLVVVGVSAETWLRSCWRGWRWGDWTGPLDGSDPIAHTGPRPGHIEEQR